MAGNPYQDTMEQQAASTASARMPLANPVGTPGRTIDGFPDQARAGVGSTAPGMDDLVGQVVQNAPDQLKSKKVSDRKEFWKGLADKLHDGWEKLTSGGGVGGVGGPFVGSQLKPGLGDALSAAGKGGFLGLSGGPSTGGSQGGGAAQVVKMGPAELSELAAGQAGGAPQGPGVAQASGGYGAQSGGQGPVVRRSGSGKSSGGGSATANEPHTMQPQSSDPDQLEAMRRGAPMDPAIAQMKEMYAKLDQKSGKIDLSPLAALTDSFTGSHFAQSYDRPLTDRQVDQMKTQLAEQMARRQADIEYHRDRVQAMLNGQQLRHDVGMDANDARRDVADTNAQSRTGVAVIRGASSAAGKVDKQNDPDHLLKQYGGEFKDTFNEYAKSMYGDRHNPKDDSWKGALAPMKRQALDVAHFYMTKYPDKYPDMHTAFAAVMDHARGMPSLLAVPGKRVAGEKPSKMSGEVGGGDGG